jgi:hypothetical protein
MTYRTGLVASSSLPFAPFFSLCLLDFVFPFPTGSLTDFTGFLWVYLAKQLSLPFIELNYPGTLDPALSLPIFISVNCLKTSVSQCVWRVRWDGSA